MRTPSRNLAVVGLLAFLFVTLSLKAATLTGMVQKATGGWATNAVLLFFPSNTPAVINGGFTLSPSARSVVGSNGWVSNQLLMGNYRFTVDQSTRDWGTLSIPSGDGTYNLWSLLSSTNILFDTNISQYVPRSEFLAASNYLFSISGGGGGGEVSTAQLNAASNHLFLLLTNYDNFSSNFLYTNLIARGVTTSNGIVALYGPQVAGLSNLIVAATNGILASVVDLDTTLYNLLHGEWVDGDTVRILEATNFAKSLVTVASNGIINLHGPQIAGLSNRVANLDGSTNALDAARIAAESTNATQTTFEASSTVALTNLANSFSAALTNLANAYSVALTNRADTNYILVNNVSNLLVAVSNRFDLFSVALTNRAATNYILVNNASNFLVSVSNRLDLFTTALTNFGYVIGANGTNYANAISNGVIVAATNIAQSAIANSNAFGSTVPLPVVWLDASRATNATGTAPQVWPDITGHGYDATNLVAANCPTLNANRINGLPAFTFDGVNDNFILKGFSSATMTTNTTVYLVYRALGAPSTTYIFAAQGNSTFAFDGAVDFVATASDSYWYPYGVAAAASPSANVHSNAWSVAGLSFNGGIGAGATYRTRINGMGLQEQAATANSLSTTGVVALGGHWTAAQTLTVAGSFDLAEVMIWTNALSVAQCVQVEDYLLKKYGMAGNQLVFDGDSNVYGYGVTAGSNIAALAVQSMAGTNGYTAVNVGFSGLNSAVWLSNLYTNVLPSIRPNAQYVLSPPVKNDFRASVSTNTSISNIWVGVTELVKRGAQVFVTDVLPDNGGGNASYDQNRINFALRFRSMATNRSGIVWVPLSASISASNANNNAALYSLPDGVNADHLTNAGAAVFASDVVNALRPGTIENLTVSSNLLVGGSITANNTGSNNAPVSFAGFTAAGLLQRTYVPSAGGGEANVTGEISVTNDAVYRFGMTYGKSGVTNLLRSVQAGYGLVGTNQNTNNIFAVDPTVIATVAWANAVSNLAYTLALNNSNLSYAIGTAGTNFSLAASNAVRLVAGLDETNHANAILQSATNLAYVLAQSASNLSYAIGTAGTNFTLLRGTNFPPAIANGGGQQASTNITVGLGVRQRITITTNASFKLVFTGTPLNGESISVGVSNTSASILYVTNTAYNVAVASNDTVWPVAATSVRWFDFISQTNWNTGTARWEVIGGSQKEMEIGVGTLNGFLAMSTNAENSKVVVSNTYIPQASSMTLSNLAGTGALTNWPVATNLIAQVVTNTVLNVLGAGSGSTNYVFTCFTNSINAFVCGSSNAHIASVSGGVAGAVIPFSIDFTNLSASVWGFTFSAGTNSWLFAGPYGTNAPTVMTNGTRFRLAGELNGSNAVVGWTTFNPAKFP